MLNSILKSNSPTLFDRKVRSIVFKVICKCDTLEQFKSRFKHDLEREVGLGEKFKESYSAIPDGEKLQIWHKNTSGDPDRLLMDIISITY